MRTDTSRKLTIRKLLVTEPYDRMLLMGWAVFIDGTGCEWGTRSEATYAENRFVSTTCDNPFRRWIGPST